MKVKGAKAVHGPPAAEVFRAKGYHASTLDDVAEVLDLRRASLYHYVLAPRPTGTATRPRSGTSRRRSSGGGR